MVALSLSKKKMLFPQLNLECIGKLRRRNSEHFELSKILAYMCLPLNFIYMKCKELYEGKCCENLI